MKEHLTVLVVDDEYGIAEAVAAFLVSKGHDALIAETGQGALALFEQRRIDFVLLDLMLPDMSGEEVCRKLRERTDVPVIILTAKTSEEDVINGLGIGADDYISKPFSLKQLYARMEAVMRRVDKAAGSSYYDGELSVDFDAMEVRKNGEEVYLTSSEWKILSVFFTNRKVVLSRDKLIENAFGEYFDGYDRIIDTHVKNLRKKLENDPKNPKYILTVRGSGYKFGG